MQDNSRSVSHAPAHSNGNSNLNGNGNAGPHPGAAISRLPWTSSPSDSEKHTQSAGAAASMFPVAHAPSPEDIPGFPVDPEEEYYSEPPTHAQRQPQAPPLQTSIRPLTGSLSPAPAAGSPAAHNQPPPNTQRPAPAPPRPPQAQNPALHTPHPTLRTPHSDAPPLMFPTGSGGPSTPTASITTGRLGYPVPPGPTGGVSTDQLISNSLDPMLTQFSEPRTIPETGINQGLISDLVLKAMYFTSYMSGQDISAVIRLPFYGVIDQVINLMKKEQLCEVSGTSGLGEAGYQYLLTVKGMERAHQVLNRSSYIGPAPVPLARYIEVIKMQSARKPTINRQAVENALRGMVMGDDLLNQIGASVNAGKSLFLFGAPGNGKTLLAERIATMLGGHIAIPYAIEADGQVIQLFDLNSHRPVVPHGGDETDPTRAELADRRWVRIHRPVVIVGGELTMPSLDLIYNENSGFYEAPFQLKANGGLFLIDDFGRQQVSPQALLNRWIVPLEKGIDYLTLKTGKKLQVPSELFLVLSTNLNPEDLIDDAFLRRIQNKLNVPDPTPQQFYDIFVAQCKSMGVPFDQNGFAFLVTKHYVEMQRPFRASHPRDLLRQLLGIAKYRNVQPEMTPPLLDAACGTYFVNAKKKA